MSSASRSPARNSPRSTSSRSARITRSVCEIALPALGRRSCMADHSTRLPGRLGDFCARPGGPRASRTARSFVTGIGRRQNCRDRAAEIRLCQKSAPSRDRHRKAGGAFGRYGVVVRPSRRRPPERPGFPADPFGTVGRAPSFTNMSIPRPAAPIAPHANICPRHQWFAPIFGEPVDDPGEPCQWSAVCDSLRRALTGRARRPGSAADR